MLGDLQAAVEDNSTCKYGRLFSVFVLNMTRLYEDIRACSMWTYNDIYKAIIKYIDTDL